MKLSNLLFSISFYIACAFIIVTTASDLHSQDSETTKAEKQNDHLGRGINLGNALEAPNLGEWGVELQEVYFEMIADKGFNSVRIPIRWNAHAQQEEPYKINETFFDTVDWAIENSLENGLYTVINIHHYNSLYENPEEQRERFLAIWEQICDRYEGYPDSLMFEILNEPHGNLTAPKWNSLLKESYQLIREKHPDRTLIAMPAEWGGVEGLRKLKWPAEDDNMILSVHYYLPFKFTHQGAEWVEGSDKWKGTEWNNSQTERDSVRADLLAVSRYANKHDVPVYIGEFGAYSEADMASRIRWTNFVSRIFEEKGFSWAYWEFCSGFGIYDPEEDKWHQGLVDALVNNPMPQPSGK